MADDSPPVAHVHDFRWASTTDGVGTYRCECGATTTAEERVPPPRVRDPDREAVLRDIALSRSQHASDYVWRDATYQAMFAHLPLSEGQWVPLGIAPTALRSLTWLAGLFEKDVPDSYVAADLNDEGYSEVRIACPCGEVHHVEIGTIAGGDCGRWFYWFGQSVRVARLEDSAQAPSAD